MSSHRFHWSPSRLNPPPCFCYIKSCTHNIYPNPVSSPIYHTIAETMLNLMKYKAESTAEIKSSHTHHTLATINKAQPPPESPTHGSLGPSATLSFFSTDCLISFSSPTPFSDSSMLSVCAGVQGCTWICTLTSLSNSKVQLYHHFPPGPQPVELAESESEVNTLMYISN